MTLTYSEPVEIVQDDDIGVVDAEGNDVTGGPATNAAEADTVDIPLRPGLGDGTYTVRSTVLSTDSHVIPEVFVFGVGPGELGPPYLEGTSEGPSGRGPGASARASWRWSAWAASSACWPSAGSSGAPPCAAGWRGRA